MNQLDRIRLEARYNGKIPKSVIVKENFSIFYKSFRKKIQYVGAIISGKRLADNKEYEGAPSVSQEVVQENPRRWIIEECIPACKILWDKNIYTFMCSDQLDANAWIELDIDNLSIENQEILEQIKERYTCYQYHKGCINISVKGMGKKAQAELIEMAKLFKMQDVPTKAATISLEELLIRCGCCKTILNPNYIPLDKQLENITLENWGSFDIQDEYITVFDKDKVDKTIPEYANQAGAVVDSETGIIYANDFHYRKHLKYISYLESLKQNTKKL